MKRYTPEDEKVIKECLKKCSTHTEAFNMAAEKLGRSAKSIEVHYYYRKRHVLALYKKEAKEESRLSRIISTVRNIFTF